MSFPSKGVDPLATLWSASAALTARRGSFLTGGLSRCRRSPKSRQQNSPKVRLTRLTVDLPAVDAHRTGFGAKVLAE